MTADIQRYTTKAAETKETFATGSQRGTRKGRGRFDLVPTMAIRRLAQVYERGADIYGPDNWQKGQSLSRYYDSAMSHLLKVRDGLEDEDHVFQAIWNLISLAWTLEAVRAGRLPRELADLPFDLSDLAKVPVAARPITPEDTAEDTPEPPPPPWCGCNACRTGQGGR